MGFVWAVSEGTLFCGANLDLHADMFSRLVQALREAMEKQRATELLMEALCLSVPRDPAVVLEVHRDVLKSRLRCACAQLIRGTFHSFSFFRIITIRVADDSR